MQIIFINKKNKQCISGIAPLPSFTENLHKNFYQISLKDNSKHDLMRGKKHFNKQFSDIFFKQRVLIF